MRHRDQPRRAAPPTPPTANGPNLQRWLLCATLLLAALFWLAPHRVADSDALSRLALGRYLWTHHSLPSADPFTFAAPDVDAGDPEWLGDLLLSAIYDRGGELALQGFALLLAALSLVLALGLGRRWGAGPGTMFLMLACALPASAPRVAARNDMHLLWIVPAFSWLASTAANRRRRWLLLLALAWCWANLHGSFVLGMPLLLAAWLDTDKPRDALPLAVLALYPALPFFGLGGASAYRQLLDHAQGAAVYTRLISEWQSPLRSGGLLAILPLHLLALLGLGCFTLDRKRLRILPTLLLLAAIALSYGSRRFLPLMATMMAPAIGASVTRGLTKLPMRAQRGVGLAIGACVCVYLGLALRSAAHRGPSSVFGDPRSAEAAARFLHAHAPPGSRVANAFNDGPWLLWWSAPRVRHYLDPRNNLGAAVLERYTDEVLRDRAHFEPERARLGIGLVLLRAVDPYSRALAHELSQAPEYAPVYWDGYHTLLAQRSTANAALIERYAYRVLRPSFDLAYLAGRDPSDPSLRRDLARLDREGPAAANAIAGYLWLKRPDAASAVRAAELLQEAVPALPDSPELLRYWRESLQRAGAPAAGSEP